MLSLPALIIISAIVAWILVFCCRGGRSPSLHIAGDWVAETAISQNVLNPAVQDLSFDIYHRCDCLTAQLGLLRERDAEGSEYKARVALSLPTLFSRELTSPTLLRHQ